MCACAVIDVRIFCFAFTCNLIIMFPHKSSVCVCALVHAHLCACPPVCVPEQKRTFLEEFGSAVVKIHLLLLVDDAL